MANLVQVRVLLALVLILGFGTALVFVATPLVRDALSTHADAGTALRSEPIERGAEHEGASAREAAAPSTVPDHTSATTPLASREPSMAPRAEPMAASSAEMPAGYIPVEPAAAKVSTAYVPPAAVPAVTSALGENAAAPRSPSDRDTAAIDINSASAEELNRLGGGRLGKAIVRGRPYGRIEELVSKRVLTRSAFSQIKSRITVR